MDLLGARPRGMLGTASRRIGTLVQRKFLSSFGLLRSTPFLLPRLAVCRAVSTASLATPLAALLAPRKATMCTGGPQHGVGLTNTVADLTTALSDPNALVVDIRTAEENAAGPSVPGALLAPWDRDVGTMPLDGLPEDKAAPLLVH